MMINKNSKSIIRFVANTLVCAVFLGGISPVAQSRTSDTHKPREIREERDIPAMYDALLKAAKPLCKSKNCNYPLVILDKDKKLNAFSDGKKVFITRGMLKFANKHDEVAIILSHEIAHNIMNHMSAKRRNVILGTVLDVAMTVGGLHTFGAFGGIGNRAHSQDFEREADYVGLYLMARAGYPVKNAAMFWRKMALKFPKNIRGSFMATHPGTAHRFVTLEKTAKEIEYKKRTHQELLPEFSSKRNRSR